MDGRSDGHDTEDQRTAALCKMILKVQGGTAVDVLLPDCGEEVLAPCRPNWLFCICRQLCHSHGFYLPSTCKQANKRNVWSTSFSKEGSSLNRQCQRCGSWNAKIHSVPKPTWTDSHPRYSDGHTQSAYRLEWREKGERQTKACRGTQMTNELKSIKSTWKEAEGQLAGENAELGGRQRGKPRREA